MTRSASISLLCRPLVPLVFLAFAACSANADDKGKFGNSADGSEPQANDPPPPDNPGVQDGGSLIDAPNQGDQSAPDESCYADRQSAERTPLAMYIMVDKSWSMTDVPQPLVAPFTTKWIAIKNAFAGFLNDSASSGISVALQYFPLPAKPFSEFQTCTAHADCGTAGVCMQTDATVNHCYPFCTSHATCGEAECMTVQSGEKVCGNDSCNADLYEQPEVAFTELPAVRSLIMASLNANRPSTATPTLPALTGAIRHASSWASGHPDHKVIVVLATDGLPSVCPVDSTTDERVQQVAAVAADGLSGTPSIKTFVIGIASGSQQNLHTIAAAGGTGQALVVQANADVTSEFADALEQIRGAALACDFQLPTSGTGPLDYNTVNVLYSDATVTESTVYYVESEGACDPQQGGWYYDINPAQGTPTRIVLCPSTCSAAQGDGAASIAVSVGCQTQTGPR